jgi:hypothetical protein
LTARSELQSWLSKFSQSAGCKSGALFFVQDKSNMSPSAIIITPGQLTRRAELYHQLSQLTAAGLPILRSLEQIERHPPSSAFRKPLRAAIYEINNGSTLTEALRRAGNWIPSFDIALLEAGERSGRLDACFSVLADYYTDRARMVVLESGAARAGEWVTETRDLAADFRAAFGEAPPDLIGIAIATDTDNTGEHATAWFGDLVLR